jgi:hypothetical protein
MHPMVVNPHPHLRQIQKATPRIQTIRKDKEDLRVIAAVVIVLQITVVHDHQWDKDVLEQV